MSSTSSSTPSDCEYDDFTFGPRTPFYPTMGHPLIYFAQVPCPAVPVKHHKEKKRTSNCFVKAFRWYTQERRCCGPPIKLESHAPSRSHHPAPRHRTSELSSRPQPSDLLLRAQYNKHPPADLAGFASWLDTKYDQYIQESHHSPPLQLKNTAVIKPENTYPPWRKTGQPVKDGGDAEVKVVQSIEFILQPKTVNRTVSESSPPTATKDCICKSQATVSSSDKHGRSQSLTNLREGSKTEKPHSYPTPPPTQKSTQAGSAMPDMNEGTIDASGCNFCRACLKEAKITRRVTCQCPSQHHHSHHHSSQHHARPFNDKPQQTEGGNVPVITKSCQCTEKKDPPVNKEVQYQSNMNVSTIPADIKIVCCNCPQNESGPKPEPEKKPIPTTETGVNSVIDKKDTCMCATPARQANLSQTSDHSINLVSIDTFSKDYKKCVVFCDHTKHCAIVLGTGRVG